MLTEGTHTTFMNSHINLASYLIVKFCQDSKWQYRSVLDFVLVSWLEPLPPKHEGYGQENCVTCLTIIYSA
jgi:hypothetical protein